MVEQINDKNFEQTLQSHNIVVVDFYAVWCGPCKMMHPIIEELAKEHTKVYYDNIKQLAQDYKGDFIYIGASKSPVGRIQNKFRYQILIRLKLDKAEEITTKLYALADNIKNSGVSCYVEINPQSLS